MSVLAGIPVLIIRPNDADADIYINHRGFSLAVEGRERRRARGRKMVSRQQGHVIFIR